MSAGRGAGIQTWAHQGDMVRLEERQFIAIAISGPYFLRLAEVTVSTAQGSRPRYNPTSNFSQKTKETPHPAYTAWQALS